MYCPVDVLEDNFFFRVVESAVKLVVHENIVSPAKFVGFDGWAGIDSFHQPGCRNWIEKGAQRIDQNSKSRFLESLAKVIRKAGTHQNHRVPVLDGIIRLIWY